MAEKWIGRVVLRTTEAAMEAERRLRAHGFDDAARSVSDWGNGFYAVDFTTFDRDPDLDFLRPDLIPPRKVCDG